MLRALTAPKDPLPAVERTVCTQMGSPLPAESAVERSLTRHDCFAGARQAAHAAYRVEAVPWRQPPTVSQSPRPSSGARAAAFRAGRLHR